MYNFDFAQPDSIEQAAAALADEDAQPLAGGQTLIPTMRARLASPTLLVSLAKIPGLAEIEYNGDGQLCIGAMATHDAVAKGACGFAALAGLAGNIGDPAVRARGTLGGSLANNDPSACYPAAVLAAGATIVTNRRQIAADDFFDGLFTTSLEPSELITCVNFPAPDAASYQKFDQPASRFALAGVFLARFDDDVRVAVTGVSEDGVFRWQDAETALRAEFSTGVLENLALSPDGLIGDLHADADYRAHLVKVLTKRAVQAINSNAGQG